MGYSCYYGGINHGAGIILPDTKIYFCVNPRFAVPAVVVDKRRMRAGVLR